MTEPLILYTNPMSRGRITRWMLEEIGEPYQVEVLEYGPAMKAPAYLAVNPMGKVPALRHGSAVVTECAAICAYLADAFPAARLAPAAGDPQRAAYYRWLFFAAGPLESAITNRSLGLVVPPEREVMAGYGNLGLVLDTIEAAVSGRAYLLGEAVSAADIYLASNLNFGMMFNAIEPRPGLVAYCEHLNARPAAQRAKELDEALIPGVPPA